MDPVDGFSRHPNKAVTAATYFWATAMFKLATDRLRLLFWVHDNITHTVEPLSWIKILDKILSADQRNEFEILQEESV